MEVQTPENNQDAQLHLQQSTAAVSELLDQLPPEGDEPIAPHVITPDPTPRSTGQEPPPPEPVTPPKDATPKTNEEIEKQLAELEPGPNAGPNAKKYYKSMRAIMEREVETRTAAENRAADLEAQLKKGEGLTPDVQQEISELRLLRKIRDAENDPEIKGKYVSKIEEGDQKATRILLNHQIDAPVLEAINKMGGITQAAQSNDKVPNELGGSGKTWAEWVETVLLPRTPMADRRRLEGIIAQGVDLSDSMKAEIDSIRANPQAYDDAVKTRHEKQFGEAMESTKSTIGKMAFKWDIPAGASKEQISEIEKHNARYDKSVQQGTKLAEEISNPRTQGTAVVLATQALYLAEANTELINTLQERDKQIATLTSQIDRTKGAGAITRATNVAPTKDEMQLKNVPNATAAVDAAFKEMDSQ